MNLDTEIIYCLRYDFHRWSWLGAYFRTGSRWAVQEIAPEGYFRISFFGHSKLPISKEEKKTNKE